MTSSLVLQTSFLGDVILTTPLIATLAAQGPVDVVATPAGASVLANNPDIRRLIAFDKRGAHRGTAGLRELARAVRAPDGGATAYCVQGSWRTGLLARLAGYRHRVGFDTSSGRLLYTRRVPYRRDQHHTERLLRLALGDAPIDPSRRRPRLYPDMAARDVVDVLLQLAGWKGELLLAVAPGSIWGTKRWPHYPALARQLTSRGRVVVIGGEDDRALARGIVEATSGSAIDATGRLTLLASAELIRRCVVLVTNDSSPQHLASAMSTPTVTIFGPTVPAFGFGPLAPRSITVGHASLDCRPCHPHGPKTCPLGHWHCMTQLEVATVHERVAALIDAVTAGRQ